MSASSNSSRVGGSSTGKLSSGSRSNTSDCSLSDDLPEGDFPSDGPSDDSSPGEDLSEEEDKILGPYPYNHDYATARDCEARDCNPCQEAFDQRPQYICDCVQN